MPCVYSQMGGAIWRAVENYIKEGKSLGFRGPYFITHLNDDPLR